MFWSLKMSNSKLGANGLQKSSVHYCNKRGGASLKFILSGTVTDLAYIWKDGWMVYVTDQNIELQA